jgi:hypothetical protein
MIVINVERDKIAWTPVQTKNGLKHYGNLAIDLLKEKDEKDNTHSVWNNQSKEDRAEKKKKEYVGRGKELKFNPATYPAPLAESKKEYSNNQQIDDLPF